jgi:hypothetical protein
MASSKKRTTMAKINRENAVREKNVRKAARKVARKQEALAPTIEPEQVEELEEQPVGAGDDR